jgi:hypothetical protein
MAQLLIFCWYFYDDAIAAFLEVPKLGEVPIIVYLVLLFLSLVNITRE